jgi:AMP-activated protein kinase-like protein
VADQHDHLLNRAIEELRSLPPLDRDAVSRIVSAASRSRDAGAADDMDLDLPRRVGGRFFSLRTVIGIAAAAAIVGFVAGMQLLGRRAASSGATQPTVAQTRVDPVPVTAVSAAPNALSAEMLPVPTQFVFKSRVAHRVALVGDFNGWDASTVATQLTRQEGGALWSVTVPLLPGRHVYAFMIDDTIVQTDPAAPETTDPDFGVKGSVIIVGKP